MFRRLAATRLTLIMAICLSALAMPSRAELTPDQTAALEAAAADPATLTSTAALLALRDPAQAAEIAAAAVGLNVAAAVDVASAVVRAVPGSATSVAAAVVNARGAGAVFTSGGLQTTTVPISQRAISQNEAIALAAALSSLEPGSANGIVREVASVFPSGAATIVAAVVRVSGGAVDRTSLTQIAASAAGVSPDVLDSAVDSQELDGAVNQARNALVQSQVSLSTAQRQNAAIQSDVGENSNARVVSNANNELQDQASKN